MAQIDDLTAYTGSINGSEEYPMMIAGIEYKVKGSEILASVQNALNSEIQSRSAETTDLASGKVDRSGGVMTGFLSGHASPASDMHYGTKGYIDAGLAGKLSKTGASLDGTATGVTAINTSESTALATTEYVANKIAYETSKQTIINAGSKTLDATHSGVILVNYTSTGTVTISLPSIASLSDPTRVKYLIVDTGDNAETNNITINRNGADTIIGGTAASAGTSYVISTDGESVVLHNDGGTQWFVADKVSAATTTKAGVVRQSTAAEVLARTNDSAFVSAKQVADILKDIPYNVNAVGAATFNLTEAMSGLIPVTYTSTAAVTALQLPDASALTDYQTVVYEIFDRGSTGGGNAETNNITITTAAGTIDGASSYTINSDGAYVKVYNDGTNWFVLSDTQRAASVVSTFNLTNNTLTTTKAALFTGSGVYTGQNLSGATNNAFVAMTQSGLTSGDVLGITASAQTSGNLLSLIGGGATLATGGSIIRADMDVATAGSGLEVVTTGVYTGADGLINLTANAATTGDVMVISGTGQTTGNMISVTGGGGNMASGGALARLNMGVATDASALELVTTGIYAGTVGLLNVTANSATTGDLVVISGTSLTTGAALSITSAVGGVAIETKAGISIHSGTSVAGGAVSAIPITQPICELTTAGIEALTLADGVEGQELKIIMVGDGGDGTLTPTNGGGYSTIVFADAGDSVSLLFTNANWYVTGIGGLAPGPVIA